MSWTDQTPEATDVLLQGKAFFEPRGEYVNFEIDRLPDGRFRATVGNLFGSEEVHRDGDLDQCLRWFSMAMTSGKRKAA
jgi:hypothetical protein